MTCDFIYSFLPGREWKVYIVNLNRKVGVHALVFMLQHLHWVDEARVWCGPGITPYEGYHPNIQLTQDFFPGLICVWYFATMYLCRNSYTHQRISFLAFADHIIPSSVKVARFVHVCSEGFGPIITVRNIKL